MERGSFRIQRIPPTETKGRMQTSIINVLLLTKPESSIVKIEDKDIVVSYYKAPGNGGQKKNKTMSAVRLQYNDLTITCCETRDQRKNKEIALERLREKLIVLEEEKIRKMIQNQCYSQNVNQGNRGSYVRNFNFQRNEVVHEDKKMLLSEFFKGNIDYLYK